MNMKQRLIDHVISVVPDLEQACATACALGFDLTKRGEHVGRGTANRLVTVPNCYWEILAVETPLLENRWADSGRAQPGLFGCALRSDDLLNDINDIALNGFPSGAATRVDRPIEADGSREVARFNISKIMTDRIFDAHLLFCQHLTPSLVRRPEETSHPNGCYGIVALDIVTDAPQPLASWLGCLFRASPYTVGQEARLQIDSICVRLYSKSTYCSRYPRAEIRKTNPGMGTFAGIHFAVPTLDRIVNLANHAAYPVQSDGGIVYLNSSALGSTIIGFQELSPFDS